MKILNDKTIDSIFITNSIQVPRQLKLEDVPYSIWFHPNLNTFFFQGTNSVYIPQSSIGSIEYCECGFESTINTVFFRVRPEILDGDINLSILTPRNFYSLYQLNVDFYRGMYNLILTTYIDSDVDLEQYTRLNIISTKHPLFARRISESVSLINGLESRIDTILHSTIMSCNLSVLEDVDYSCILAGKGVQIRGNDSLKLLKSYIINGENNIISKGRFGLGILNGLNNEIIYNTIPFGFGSQDPQTTKTIINGINNRISPLGDFDTIINGTTNNIFACQNSGIINGANNILFYTKHSCIENGYSNRIGMVENVVQFENIKLENSYISNGSRNIITHFRPESWNYIENGVGNGMVASLISTILNGVTNKFGFTSDPKNPIPTNGGKFSIICTGVNNTIGDRRVYTSREDIYMQSTLINGIQNVIEDPNYRYPIIFTGDNNTIKSHLSQSSINIKIERANSRSILNGTSNSLSTTGYILNGENNTISGYFENYNFITNGKNNRIRNQIVSSSVSETAPGCILNGYNNNIVKNKNQSILFINCTNTNLDISMPSATTTNICVINSKNPTTPIPISNIQNALYIPNLHIHGALNYRYVLKIVATNATPFINIDYNVHIVLVELQNSIQNPIELRLEDNAKIDGKEFIVRVYSSSPGLCQLNIIEDIILYNNIRYTTNLIFPSNQSTNFTLRFMFKNRLLYLQQTSQNI